MNENSQGDTLNAQHKFPLIVAWLGYCGLLPFLSLAVLANADTAYGLLYRSALFSYGAIILSFVGALHWGFAMALSGLTEKQRQTCFGWSVIPALIAWSTCMLGPAATSCVLTLGFLLQFWRDLSLSRQCSLPAWFLPLRMRLTAVACLSLIIGFFSLT